MHFEILFAVFWLRRQPICTTMHIRSLLSHDSNAGTAMQEDGALQMPPEHTKLLVLSPINLPPTPLKGIEERALTLTMYVALHADKSSGVNGLAPDHPHCATSATALPPLHT